MIRIPSLTASLERKMTYNRKSEEDPSKRKTLTDIQAEEPYKGWGLIASSPHRRNPCDRGTLIHGRLSTGHTESFQAGNTRKALNI